MGEQGNTWRVQVSRAKVRYAARWVGAYAIPLWVAVGFSAMALTATLSDSPRYTAIWPPLFLAVAGLSLASILRPSPKTAALCGSLLAMVGISRSIFMLEYYYPFWGNSHAIMHVLLWGLHIVVGLRWPQVVYESTLRHALAEAKDQPPEPDYDLGG